MKSKYAYISIPLVLFTVLLIAYPSIQNSLNDKDKNSYMHPEKVETFSKSEQGTSQNTQNKEVAGSSHEHAPLIGSSEDDLHQLKLHDSEAFFRESYRKKVLGEGERVPVYYTKEARKRAAQHKLSERLVAHMNKENT